MRNLILLNVLIIGLITSCDKDDNSLKSNAEIIDFNPDKCGCCWGWTIKMGNDTIKSDNVIIGETVGYEIKNPIKVYIELGEIEDTCSNLGFTNPDLARDYYKIEKIKKIE
ncbi:hypothetical protein ES705_35399 [subsurface metagenome]